VRWLLQWKYLTAFIGNDKNSNFWAEILNSGKAASSILSLMGFLVFWWGCWWLSECDFCVCVVEHVSIFGKFAEFSEPLFSK
jgi:hypothetical protein